MTNGYLFQEYISAQFTGVQFSDVPINAFVSFDFILSFAINYTPVGQQQPTPAPTNGVFTPFWNTGSLSPSAVAAFKAAHPNVAVIAGLGCDSVQSTSAVFTPTSVDSWVANLVTSLTGIINAYGLDGVDVDYKHFVAGAERGHLLTRLKKMMPNIATSIAPFEDPADDPKAGEPALLAAAATSAAEWYGGGRVFAVRGYLCSARRVCVEVVSGRGPSDKHQSNEHHADYATDDEQVANYPGAKAGAKPHEKALHPCAKVLASFKTGSVTGLISPDLGISGAKEL
ncbi:chitinase 2-like [Panicum miliaceum]|uniref:Chitinase 2-like n=1 Tax=Panicum miliaceum TaxID=4540 RepID=A0A3L6PLA1_PANMI|nr:chitinase 2-like [Panicum miliaceum]